MQKVPNLCRSLDLLRKGRGELIHVSGGLACAHISCTSGGPVSMHAAQLVQEVAPVCTSASVRQPAARAN